MCFSAHQNVIAALYKQACCLVCQESAPLSSAATLKILLPPPHTLLPLYHSAIPSHICCSKLGRAHTIPYSSPLFVSDTEQQQLESFESLATILSTQRNFSKEFPWQSKGLMYVFIWNEAEQYDTVDKGSWTLKREYCNKACVNSFGLIQFKCLLGHQGTSIPSPHRLSLNSWPDQSCKDFNQHRNVTIARAVLLYFALYLHYTYAM